MNLGILVPILLGLGLFAMIFGLRYLQNKENMALIQNGLEPKQAQSLPQPYKYLKWGLLLMGAGVGLFTAYILDNTAFRDLNDEEAVYFSMIGFFGGLGLIVSFFIEKKHLK